MTTETPNPETTIDFILDLFAQQGAREYMGEAVSMSQHMEQSATCAAAERFEVNPYHNDTVKLRYYDDDGKVAGLTIKPVRITATPSSR